MWRCHRFIPWDLALAKVLKKQAPPLPKHDLETMHSISSYLPLRLCWSGSGSLWHPRHRPRPEVPSTGIAARSSWTRAADGRRAHWEATLAGCWTRTRHFPRHFQTSRHLEHCVHLKKLQEKHFILGKDNLLGMQQWVTRWMLKLLWKWGGTSCSLNIPWYKPRKFIDVKEFEMK